MGATCVAVGLCREYPLRAVLRRVELRRLPGHVGAYWSASAHGTPLAVQLVAPDGGEQLLLGVATLLERLAPWARVAPGF